MSSLQPPQCQSNDMTQEMSQLLKLQPGLISKAAFPRSSPHPGPHTASAADHAVGYVSSSTRSALEETLPITGPVFSVIAMCHDISKM